MASPKAKTPYLFLIAFDGMNSDDEEGSITRLFRVFGPPNASKDDVLTYDLSEQDGRVLGRKFNFASMCVVRTRRILAVVDVDKDSLIYCDYHALKDYEPTIYEDDWSEYKKKVVPLVLYRMVGDGKA